MRTTIVLVTATILASCWSGTSRSREEASSRVFAAAAGPRQDLERVLQASPEDAKALDANHQTPLFVAASHDRADNVRLLLRAGVNPHDRDREGRTALTVAAQAGAVRAIQALLEGGASSVDGTYGGAPDSVHAVRSGKIEALAALLEGSQPVRDVVFGAFYEAVALCNPSMLTYLADTWDPRMRISQDRGGELAAFAVTKRCVSALDILLTRTCDPISVSARTSEGYTLLQVAAVTNSVESARFLLSRGATVNEAAPDGNTALMLAMRSVHQPNRVAEILLDEQIDVDIRANDGTTALRLAVMRGSLTWVRRLLLAGARTSDRGPDGLDILELARKLGNDEIVALLASPVPSRPSNSMTSCPPSMERVEGGRFWAGAEVPREDSEPRREENLAAYCLDRTEVTAASYFSCISAGVCPTAPLTAHWRGIAEQDAKEWGAFCNKPGPDSQEPMNCVDWYMANTYCRWSENRLPTSAEWERAARGTDQRVFPWGDEGPDKRMTNLNGVGTKPVASYPMDVSPNGIKDMAGNVAEWVSDRSGKYPGDVRGYRGGAWSDTSSVYLRNDTVRPGDASSRAPGIGFRCARSP